MKSKIAILGIIFFLFGGGAGWWLNAVFVENDEAPITKIIQRNHQYEFVNPLLGFEVNPEERPEEWKELEENIQSLVEDRKKDGALQSASVYIRDLKTGFWGGVNENESFQPASLLKVFIMIAHLKQGEINPQAYFGRKLYYDAVQNMNILEHYPPAVSLKKGWHPIDTLMEKMIVESGNNSLVLLRNDIGAEKIHELYTNFPLPVPDDINSDFMTAKQYSILFRVLYNATYLSSDMSEKALSILSRTTFKNGLVAGVPGHISVSHKFGEATNELHDCGIVFTSSPYFICVMTKGPSFPVLERVIANISKLTYQAIVR